MSTRSPWLSQGWPQTQGGEGTILLRLTQASHMRNMVRKGTVSMSTVQPQPTPVPEATHPGLDADVLMMTPAPVTAARKPNVRYRMSRSALRLSSAVMSALPTAPSNLNSPMNVSINDHLFPSHRGLSAKWFSPMTSG